ncbi:protease HtpX [Bacillus atrophaeus]|uniref:protease HtpX n=1 Tax=Bacillus atrophaeus TaxID=1452 RepID=UPI00077B0701|nr:protease HtpX [Bacillus atrophaeus]ATO29404.1 protease HtpX [Bacillus atrophaeus]KXZ14210.1 zinc metalloprotease HtpX [Bacillus atrophaeus]MCY8521453.1 protease HtpX [Bacillus atrophaeus]MCY8525288.1 protease HtpX [Bacillus atrophaeus]MCY8809719.1 protease HtpX [Bacillus atrophaeus]
MAKRIFLFILTNILVITTIGIVLSIIGAATGVGTYFTGDGRINVGALLVFSLVVGFVGSFMSLLMSRWMAKMMMGVRVLNPEKQALSHDEQQLVDRVHRLSRAAGLTKMPEVGIYNSSEVNAFATGPSKRRSLVAVSSGLLQQMDDAAVEGVLAHEVAHIANGDMVTMTLLQGIVNTFVVFLSRIAAWIASRFVKEDLAPIVHFIAVIVFQIVFSILGSLVVFAYSRHREFHADRGGADLAGKDKMIHALQTLKHYSSRVVEEEQTAVQTLKINGKKHSSLFSTHPDLDERIRRLEAK